MEKEKIKILELKFNYDKEFDFKGVNVKFTYDNKKYFIIIQSPKELTIDEIKHLIIKHYERNRKVW